MKISGIMQFQGMNASGVNLIREFQSNCPDVRITFNADFSAAIVEWESFSRLPYLIRLAAAVQVCNGSHLPPAA